MRRIIFSSVACLVLSYFFTLSHRRHELRIKMNDYNILPFIVPCINCVACVLFVCKRVLLPPGVNPTAVKYIILYHCIYSTVKVSPSTALGDAVFRLQLTSLQSGTDYLYVTLVLGVPFLSTLPKWEIRLCFEHRGMFTFKCR